MAWPRRDINRDVVEREIASKFATMRIGWESGAIEGGGDSVVFKSNAAMVVDGGHMKEFAGHAFHEACIKQWLLRHDDSCPLCRRALPVWLGRPQYS